MTYLTRSEKHDFEYELPKLVRGVMLSGSDPDKEYYVNLCEYYHNIIQLLEYLIERKEKIGIWLVIQQKKRLKAKTKSEVNFPGCRIDFIQLYAYLKSNPLSLKLNMFSNISDVKKYPDLQLMKKHIKNLHQSLYSIKKIEPYFAEKIGCNQLTEMCVKPQTNIPQKHESCKSSRRMIPDIPLPFCNKLNPNGNTCHAIIRHYGLYVQCFRLADAENKYCRYCLTKGIKYGDIHERLNNPQWICKFNNEKPVHYQVVRNKFNITQKRARESAKKMAWTISPEQLKGNGKRGRKPSKKVKTIEVIEDHHDDDILKRLIADAVEVSDEENEEEEAEEIEEIEEEGEVEVEVEIEVVEIKIGKDTFYIDDDKIIYDVETNEEIGKYINGELIRNG
jgi:hypothetical protein